MKPAKFSATAYRLLEHAANTDDGRLVTTPRRGFTYVKRLVDGKLQGDYQPGLYEPSRIRALERVGYVVVTWKPDRSRRPSWLALEVTTLGRAVLAVRALNRAC